jgi:hypothetical protein
VQRLRLAERAEGVHVQLRPPVRLDLDGDLRVLAGLLQPLGHQPPPGVQRRHQLLQVLLDGHIQALGYRPVYTYRSDQLGIQASAHGAIMVEGSWCCPSMPSPLINATKDLHADKIDPETWAKRITAREPYRLPRKGKPAKSRTRDRRRDRHGRAEPNDRPRSPTR